MIFNLYPSEFSPRREALDQLWLADETVQLDTILDQIQINDASREQISQTAHQLVEQLRAYDTPASTLDNFLQEYDLSSEEGIVLMCLAEALLRIPDSVTADRLIQDKLGSARWMDHLGNTDSLLVNAGTWGLLLTGKIIEFDRQAAGIGHFLARLVKRCGEPLLRSALTEAMRILGHQFVMGETITAAIKRSQLKENSAYRYSFDMLGEAALTSADAQRYLDNYHQAITALTKHATAADFYERPGISVKLSALHPRYELAHSGALQRELVPRVIELARQACQAGISMTLDAEEAARLDPMLDIFAALANDPVLRDWPGLGLAVQAYQKRALAVLDWLDELAGTRRQRFLLRLVKGAYWDSEIKHAQEQGLAGYPVYTRKVATDVTYLACMQRLFDKQGRLYPQIASHNAHTVAAALVLAEQYSCPFEFQRLHGMGEALYQTVMQQLGSQAPCRVYAPVGGYQVLLAYLVRRLLENGANTSFVNRISQQQMPIAKIIADPLTELSALQHKPHPAISLPADLYGSRKNAPGMLLSNKSELYELQRQLQDYTQKQWLARPMIAGIKVKDVAKTTIMSPGDINDLVGHCVFTQAADMESALTGALQVFPGWSRTDCAVRADMIEQAAELMLQQRTELLALLMREGGRCLADAIAELREAVDYCRYYAQQARQLLAQADTLPGPTGESNQLYLRGRGVFVAISPWNFPLAIFTGQVVAALVCGNCVLAKPASHTPLVAMRVCELLHEAGIPQAVLQFVPATSKVVEHTLLDDPRIAGVVFTGSVPVARQINHRIAARPAAIIPLIAETGGLNVMIADSTTLPEQLVQDVMVSAFNSAGQRCSALRVLFIQQQIADAVLELLEGAMNQLVVGRPGWLNSDIGPLIDAEALACVTKHIEALAKAGSRVFQADITVPDYGHYVPPTICEISHLSQLSEEVFGPVLHIIRFDSDAIDEVIEQVNASGYGLTMGVHSRINERADYIRQRVQVGNLYVNRNMIGAVVGVQPFGGEGLSGTGPKAGGPNYLRRFVSEQTVTINTAAIGGNASILMLTDDNEC